MYCKKPSSGVLLLQAEYKKAVSTNQWHRRLEFPSGETIVMHNPKVELLTKWGDGVAMVNASCQLKLSVFRCVCRWLCSFSPPLCQTSGAPLRTDRPGPEWWREGLTMPTMKYQMVSSPLQRKSTKKKEILYCLHNPVCLWRKILIFKQRVLGTN